MTWTRACDRNHDSRRCEGGICPACEACDIHCQCADTEEVRHIAGATISEIDP